MWNNKRVLLVASSRSSLRRASHNVLRKNRAFSSVNTVYHDEEDSHGDPSDTMKQQEKALQQLLQMASSSPAHVTKDPPSLPPLVDLNDGAIKNRLQPAREEGDQISPSELTYTGDATMPITSDLHIVDPSHEDAPRGTWPVFRIMDEDGSLRDGKTDAFVFDETLLRDTPECEPAPSSGTNEALQALRVELKKTFPKHKQEIERNGLLFPSIHDYADIGSNDSLRRAYIQMVRLREMDQILQNAQRQGRISFYMTCRGEEAIHIGAASALDLQDTVLAQYREAGILMWRGFTLEQFTDQCFSNKSDLGKGRQMPVHYGSKALNYQTISSPLGTQIPQAAGAAYRLKLQGKKAVAACFFGDGCASTTDFHSGLNFAATLGSPVIFFCRNNGYAISTSVDEQYAGDGIVSRAPGYGMAAIRVDGNDVLAAHAAVREARKYALKHSAPVLIEAMTYRGGHHSTSDDSLRYRSANEVQTFQDRGDPLNRLEKFLERHGQMTSDDFAAIRNQEKAAVIDAMKGAERKPTPALEDLFNDVYSELPESLKGQQRLLYEHLQKYPNEY